MRALPALRVALPALAAWIVLGACGGGGDAGDGDRASDPPMGGGLGFFVAVSPEPPVEGRQVTWSLTVRNEGVEAVELTFPSGKSGDVVLRRSGREAYRWSEGRFFTEAVRHERLAANEERIYRLEEPELDVEPGSYQLVATLASDPAPEPVRRPVEVAGS